MCEADANFCSWRQTFNWNLRIFLKQFIGAINTSTFLFLRTQIVPKPKTIYLCRRSHCSPVAQLAMLANLSQSENYNGSSHCCFFCSNKVFFLFSLTGLFFGFSLQGKKPQTHPSIVYTLLSWWEGYPWIGWRSTAGQHTDTHDKQLSTQTLTHRDDLERLTKLAVMFLDYRREPEYAESTSMGRIANLMNK